MKSTDQLAQIQHTQKCIVVLDKGSVPYREVHFGGRGGKQVAQFHSVSSFFSSAEDHRLLTLFEIYYKKQLK